MTLKVRVPYQSGALQVYAGSALTVPHLMDFTGCGLAYWFGRNCYDPIMGFLQSSIFDMSVKSLNLVAGGGYSPPVDSIEHVAEYVGYEPIQHPYDPFLDLQRHASWNEAVGMTPRALLRRTREVSTGKEHGVEHHTLYGRGVQRFDSGLTNPIVGSEPEASPFLGCEAYRFTSDSSYTKIGADEGLPYIDGLSVDTTRVHDTYAVVSAIAERLGEEPDGEWRRYYLSHYTPNYYTWHMVRGVVDNVVITRHDSGVLEFYVDKTLTMWQANTYIYTPETDTRCAWLNVRTSVKLQHLYSPGVALGYDVEPFEPWCMFPSIEITDDVASWGTSDPGNWDWDAYLGSWEYSSSLAPDVRLKALGFYGAAQPLDEADILDEFGVLDDFRLRPAGGTYISRHALANWAFQVSTDLNNIRPSAFHSSSDAVAQFLDILQNEHWETLSELGELASLIPNWDSFGQLAGAIARHDIVGAGLSLVDVITDADLLYSFGLRPTFGSLLEFSQEFDRLTDRLRSAGLLGRQVLHGKFTYPMVDPYGYGDAYLVTRSRVDLRFDSSSLLTLVVGGSALGLGRALTGVWDMIPFSFVVDWFLNIGGRIENIDNSARMLMIRPSVLTHSYSVYQDLSDEILLTSWFEHDPSYPAEKPGFKSYYREVSAFFPALRSSKYDFDAPSGDLPVHLMGSLAWSLIR